MIAIKALFDGEKVILPEEARGVPAGEVILVFENGAGSAHERQAWTQIQEGAFRKVWDNDDDAIYDTL